MDQFQGSFYGPVVWASWILLRSVLWAAVLYRVMDIYIYICIYKDSLDKMGVSNSAASISWLHATAFQVKQLTSQVKMLTSQVKMLEVSE